MIVKSVVMVWGARQAVWVQGWAVMMARSLRGEGVEGGRVHSTRRGIVPE